MCKGYAIYCFQTDVNIMDIPANTTLLYLKEVTSSNTLEPQHQNTYPYMSFLNMTDCRMVPRVVYKLLRFLPNLRVLLMQNASITDLSWGFFALLEKMQILELQSNHIHTITSRCFLGSKGVQLLDLHSMSISVIQSKSFEGMSSLKLLNLSYNKLEHLTHGILQATDSLFIVDLRGNALRDIHVQAFYGLDIIIYTSAQQMCCFVPSTSACYIHDLRYYN